MKKIVLFLCSCLISFSGWTGIILLSYHLSEKCPSDKPFLGTYGGCRGCDELESLMLDYKEDTANFEICQNREIVKIYDWGEFRSRLKKCPASHPVRDFWDSCVSCDGPIDIRVGSEVDCNVCPNREVKQDTYRSLVCRLKHCPDETPLDDEYECLSCNSPYMTYNDKETCEKCPNRQYISEKSFRKTNEDGSIITWYSKSGCYLKGTDDSPLFFVELDKRISKPQKDGTYIGEGKLHLFVADDPSPKRNRIGQPFYSCDEKDDIQTLPEICAKCPNREYVDGKCVLKIKKEKEK